MSLIKDEKRVVIAFILIVGVQYLAYLILRYIGSIMVTVLLMLFII